MNFLNLTEMVLSNDVQVFMMLSELNQSIGKFFEVESVEFLIRLRKMLLKMLDLLEKENMNSFRSFWHKSNKIV